MRNICALNPNFKQVCLQPVEVHAGDSLMLFCVRLFVRSLAVNDMNEINLKLSAKSQALTISTMGLLKLKF